MIYYRKERVIIMKMVLLTALGVGGATIFVTDIERFEKV